MRVLRCLSAAAIAATFVTIGCSSSDSGGPSGTDSGHPSDSSVSDSIVNDSNTGDTTVKDSGSPVDAHLDTTPPGDGGSCASRHPGDECDMVAQTGCTGTDTCDFDTASGHSKCMANPIGTGAKGDPCDTSTKLCDKGLFCYEGHCSPACCPGDNSVCGSAGTVPGVCNLDITQPGDAGDTIIYNVCTYSTPCHAFKYDCPDNQDCLFDTAPDSFSCQPPSKPSAYSAVPGTTCTYSNDCGESQGCFTTDGGKTFKCFLFCWLTTPSGFTPGTDAKGRFAANGTCTVGGTSYGTCSDASSAGIGGGLGLCL